MAAEYLITEHIDLWTSAIKVRNTQGRGSNKKRELYGINKVRELILELAVRGKLEPQDPNDEPASVLLERIAAKKEKRTVDKENSQQSLPNVSAFSSFELPEGWCIERLGNISLIERGGSPRPIKSFLTDDPEGLNWIKIGDTDQGGKYITSTNERIRHEGLSKTRMVYPGDFLLTNSMSFGRPYISKIEGCIHDGWLRISPPYELDKDFLYILLSSPLVFTFFKASAAGAVVQNLNADKVRELPTPVPPLAEQHRIVAKVDELMALCDQLEQQTEASLDAHQQLVDTLLTTLTIAKDADELSESWARLMAADGLHAGSADAMSDEANYCGDASPSVFDTLFTNDYAVEQLKQTILQLAVMGKLVPQDPNDEPASELLKRIDAEKERLHKDKIIKQQKLLSKITDEEKPFEPPEGWAISRLGELLPEFQNGASSRGDKDGEEIVAIRLADISDWKISTADTRSLLINKKSISRYLIEKNDILIIRVNGSAGIVGRFVFCEKDFNAIYCDHFIRMRFPVEVFNPEYLSLLASSSLIRKQIEDMFISTAGQKTVNQKHIGSLLVTLPPINEQRRIIAKVDQLISLCDQLKNSLSEAQITQLHLADAAAYEVIGGPVRNTEYVEVNMQTMKITTILSLDQKEFEDSAVIAPVIRELGGSADAKDVWNKTHMSLPDFYAQLKIEIEAKYIAMPARADF